MQTEFRLSAEEVVTSRLRLRDGGLLRPRQGALAQGGIAAGIFLMVSGLLMMVSQLLGDTLGALAEPHVPIVLVGSLMAISAAFK